MLYIEPPSTDAAFHFAAEEYAMAHFGRQPVMMIWQTGPCAMLGRNQIADAEIDLNLARRRGIQVVRRSSGGGTIFTDAGTLLFTMILSFRPGDDCKQMEREQVARPVARALRRLGIPAIVEGRNDMTVEGKKFSGLAQYLQGGRLCTHGSLLYNADLELLAQVLKPDEEKIKSKALRSARSRVTNLVDYMHEPLGVRGFREALKLELFHADKFQEICFTADDLAAIQSIRDAKYASAEWLYGHAPPFTFHNRRRFSAGAAEIFLDIKNNVIASCRICGDFLSLAPVSELEARLTGLPYHREDLTAALENASFNFYLGGITTGELIDLFF